MSGDEWSGEEWSADDAEALADADTAAVGDGTADSGHIPVLPAEIIDLLSNVGRRVIVDCTLGLGGHSRMLLEHAPHLQVIGVDRDAANLSLAREQLAAFGDRVRFIHANFAELAGVLNAFGVKRVDGILADLGFSSNQMADPQRGLSFERDGPLDMRLDQQERTTAADLVNTLGEGELSDLLYFQSQERHSRKIAKRICQVRRQGRLNSTVELARLIASAVGESAEGRRGKIHPATRTFMALRMAVNRETESLRSLLQTAPDLLATGGRIVVISFHSVEDRIVKDDFRERARSGVYRLVTRKPLVADDQERTLNRRSRSAKLRCAERLVT
ncbi:MAG: 16S rRNA (cytosine(1402)-N(4))-methyltransferase RsmH [Phycisphaerae bacterium]|nr:16S rRNA (cytosine(1402)-N(4))-methyltransferase RsmH [Phycisphaerae bacterium]